MLRNKPRGVRRVSDRRVLNGIFWELRSGAPWRDLPYVFGPYTPVRLEKAIGGTADTWPRAQMNYDLAKVRKRQGSIKVRRLMRLSLLQARD